MLQQRIRDQMSKIRETLETQPFEDNLYAHEWGTKLSWDRDRLRDCLLAA